MIEQVSRAEFDDLANDLRFMGARYAEEVHIKRYDPDATVRMVRLFIDKGLGQLFIARLPDTKETVGMCFVILSPDVFFDMVNATMLFWYVVPTARVSSLGGLLLLAAQDWARENGAKTFTVSKPPEFLSNPTYDLNIHKNYQLVELAYRKELCPSH